MVTTPAVAPEPQAPINHLGRIFGALFSPKATFEDIARRPSWVAPIILLSILSTGVAYFLNTRMNWGSYIRQKAEENARFAQLPEEQKDRALAPQVKFAPYFSYCFGVIGPAIFALFFGLVYWASFNLFTGAGLKYSSSFGIAAHATIPSAITSILAIITLALKSPGDVDPEHMVASSVSSFLGSDAPKWLVALGNSLELSWIWILILFAIGFSAANPKKIKAASAFGVVFGLWLVWVLLKVGWAAI
jgi:Yip1-like protein